MMMTDGGFDDNYDNDDDESVMNDSYRNFFYSFDAMVGEDPQLYQDVLFVIDERSKLKRELKEDEFPPGILEAFVLPSSWSSEKKNNVMNRAITEYSKFNYWDKMYQLLLMYKDREGHCSVPQKHEEDGEKLGRWLGAQRALMNKGRLDPGKEKLLEDIGVVWDVLSQQWENNLILLVKYKNREGQCDVPALHKEDGENLGVWLSRQRDDNKKGKLNADQIKRFDEIGVFWDVLHQKWENYYNFLMKYKDREGHCNVPEKHKEDEENLGNWLTTQC